MTEPIQFRPDSVSLCLPEKNCGYAPAHIMYDRLNIFLLLLFSLMAQGLRTYVGRPFARKSEEKEITYYVA